LIAGAVDDSNVMPLSPGSLFVYIDAAEHGWVIRMSVIPTYNFPIRVSVFQTATHVSLSRSAKTHMRWTRLKLVRASIFRRHYYRVRPSLRIFTNSTCQQSNGFIGQGAPRLIPDEIEHIDVHVSEEAVVITRPTFEGRIILGPWPKQVGARTGPCPDRYVCHGALYASTVLNFGET
jgi:hypothetical protein